MFSCAFYVTKGESCFRILFLETVKTISILISLTLTLALALVLSQVNIQKEGKENPSAVRAGGAPVRPEARLAARHCATLLSRRDCQEVATRI